MVENDSQSVLRALNMGELGQDSFLFQLEDIMSQVSDNRMKMLVWARRSGHDAAHRLAKWSLTCNEF